MQQIFVHGLGQTPDSWEKCLALLKPAVPVICPDLAGLCRDGQVSYRRLYDSFSKLCDAVDEKIDLCGLSLGAVLALDYALAHPERVRSLALIAAQYKMPRGLLRLQNALFCLMPRGVFQQTGFEKQAFIRLCRTMADLDFSGSVRRVACPVLVLCGERDRANKAAAVSLAGLLQHAELQFIGGAGHVVNTEAPEALAKALLAFYKRLQKADTAAAAQLGARSDIG